MCPLCLSAASPFASCVPVACQCVPPGRAQLPVLLAHMVFSLQPAWSSMGICPTPGTGFCICLCWTLWRSRQPISSAATYYMSVTTSALGSASNDPAERQKCKMRDMGPISHKIDNKAENVQDNRLNANGWYRDSSGASRECSDIKLPELQSCQSLTWYHQSHWQ